MKVRGTPDSLSGRELREYYDTRFRQRPLRAREGFYSWIAARTLPPAGSRILDIGCGGGYLLKHLTGAGYDSCGCDISEEALKIAGDEAPEARLVAVDAQQLPFPDGRFDLVYNLGSLEHFLDMETALREMRRVLSPKGRAVVMVPNSRYAGDIWRKITFRGGADHHQALERFGRLGEWSRLLESGGFVIESVFPYNKFKLRLRLVPLAFSYCFVFICKPS